MNSKNARYSTISPVLPATLDAFASNSNRSVFVRDLPFCCTAEELRILFQREAEIELEDAVICRNNEGKTLQYGCVMFYQEKDVDKVIDKLNGFRYHGRDIRIIKYNKDAMMESSSAGAVLVSFKGTSQELELITEATIRAAFEQFGEISHVSIRSHLYNSYGIQGGFGFLGFVDSSVNDRVVAEINQTVLGGVQYDCNWSKHMNKNGPGSDGVGYPADGNSFFKRKNNNNNNNIANSSQKENSSRYGQQHQNRQQQSNQNYSQQQQAPQPPQPMHYLYSTPSNGPFLPTYHLSANMPPSIVTSSVYPPMYANPMSVPMTATVVGPNMNMGMMMLGQNGGYYVPSAPGIVPTEPMQTNSASYTPPYMQPTYPTHVMPVNMQLSSCSQQQLQQQPSSHNNQGQQLLSSHATSASSDGTSHASGVRPSSSKSVSSLPSPQSHQASSHRPQHSNFIPQTAPGVSTTSSPIASQSPIQSHQKPPYQQTQQQQKHAQAPQQGGASSSNHAPSRANKGAHNPPASSSSAHSDSAQQPLHQHHRRGMITNATQSTYPSSSPQQQQLPPHQQPQRAVSNHQGKYPSHPNSNSMAASPHLSPMMPSPAQSQLPQSIQQQQQSPLSHVPSNPSSYQQSFASSATSVNNPGTHLLPNTHSSPQLTHTSPHMSQPSSQQQPQPTVSYSVPVVPPPLPTAMGYMPSPQLQQHQQLPQIQQSPPMSYISHSPPVGMQYNQVQHSHAISSPPMQQQPPQLVPYAMIDASSSANMVVYQAPYPYSTPANASMNSTPQAAGNYMAQQPNAQPMKAQIPANNTTYNYGYYPQPQN